MLLVPVGQLKPDMVLAQSVFHPDCPDMVLLSRDYVLDREMIQRLRDFDLKHVWVRFPNLGNLGTVPNEQVCRGHMVLCDAIDQAIDQLEHRVAIKSNLHRLKLAIGHMMTEILVQPNHGVITHQLVSCGPKLSGHLANCCYLSLLVGAQMSGYLRSERRAVDSKMAENTAQLGLGALLHDIGKQDMLEDFREKTILSSEADWSEYQMHVRVGYEAVRQNGSALAANVVLNHHQRFDGTGFPVKESPTNRYAAAPLKGRNIHIFSRIVSVVDVFDHLLCLLGPSAPTIVAICELRSERFRGWFDPVVLETLIRLVPPFMVGSVVSLSDGTEAVVVNNHPESPCRPSVALLSGPLCEKDTRLRGRTIDLRMCPKPTVAFVDDFDVRPYLFAGRLESSTAAVGAC